MSGLQDKILALYFDGIKQYIIAKKLSCTPAYVSTTIREYRHKQFRIALPPQDEVDWLFAEARKAKVAPSEMARALLLDAIHDAMDKEKA